MLILESNLMGSSRAFTRLISQVKEGGIEVIWNQIKDKVADTMFDEFGSLYRNRADILFTDLKDHRLLKAKR